MLHGPCQARVSRSPSAEFSRVQISLPISRRHLPAPASVQQYKKIKASSCTAASSIELPPKTCSAAVAQARAAWRRFREAQAEGVPALRPDPTQPYRALITLPLPVAGDDTLRELDEADWPGGVLQKFRALRPLVEGLLYGYDAEFLGMLESPNDGVGAWATPDATLAVGVSDATFAPFVRLCGGEFGARPLQPEHTVVAVNASWTSSANIGQFWDRGLKARAVELIDEAHWEVLYHLQPVRTGAGATGVLLRSFPGAWKLHYTPSGEASQAEECILSSALRPDRAATRAALNEAQQRQRDSGQKDAGRLWWW